MKKKPIEDKESLTTEGLTLSVRAFDFGRPVDKFNLPAKRAFIRLKQIKKKWGLSKKK